MAAVEIAGSQSALARMAEVSSTAVWKWVQSSKRLPAEYVLRVEAATGVSRHHLRPDIYPVEMPEASSRWSGIDQRAGARSNGVDARTRRVAVNRRQISNGARL
ncbi:transcriptional regulator [Novosphingobium guangzhouense]|nr:YdaS family helix-turn-helix protein [Novosphingobium guangzhouense]